MKLGEIDEGTGPKECAKFHTSDHAVLGVAIDSHRRDV